VVARGVDGGKGCGMFEEEGCRPSM
jgi:hypothetical protein